MDNLHHYSVIQVNLKINPDTDNAEYVYEWIPSATHPTLAYVSKQFIETYPHVHMIEHNKVLQIGRLLVRVVRIEYDRYLVERLG